MSNPRPESRIKSLEQRATDIEADIVELSSDTAEELKAIRQDIKRLNDDTMTSFEHIGATFVATWDDAKALLASKEDINRLEATMATKDDLTAMQGQIKQDTGTIETRLDRMESDVTSIKSTQEQILKLLQQKPGQ